MATDWEGWMMTDWEGWMMTWQYDMLPDWVRAEIERLTHLVQEIEDRRRNLEDVSCNQQADIMHLRAAVERLTRERDALKEAAEALLYWQDNELGYNDDWDAVIAKARAALKGAVTPAEHTPPDRPNDPHD